MRQSEGSPNSATIGGHVTDPRSCCASCCCPAGSRCGSYLRRLTAPPATSAHPHLLLNGQDHAELLFRLRTPPHLDVPPKLVAFRKPPGGRGRYLALPLVGKVNLRDNQGSRPTSASGRRDHKAHPLNAWQLREPAP